MCVEEGEGGAEGGMKGERKKGRPSRKTEEVSNDEERQELNEWINEEVEECEWKGVMERREVLLIISYLAGLIRIVYKWYNRRSK